MVTWTYKIQDSGGLHARPASKLVMEALKYQSSIRITCGKKQADARDILDVMALGAERGTEITVEAEGEDEIDALEAVKTALVCSNDLNSGNEYK